MAEPLNPSPATLGRSRRRAARRLVAGGAAAVVLLAGGVAVAGGGSSSSGGYRTATVATHSVSQVLDAVATVEPVSQAAVAFPVSGTVAAVAVAQGDTVQVGQVLAGLDTGALQDAWNEAQASLDQAELTLERALAGEDVTGLGGSGAGSGSGSGGTPTATGISSTGATDPSVSAAVQPLATGGARVSYVSASPTEAAAGEGPTDAEISAAQQAVLDATRVVDADLAAAQAALDSAIQVCAAVGQPVADPTDDDATVDDATDDEADATTDDGIEACRDALQAVLDAQQLVAADQLALNDAATALDALLAERAVVGPTTPTGPSTPTTAPGSGTGPAGSGSAGGTGPAGGAPSTGSIAPDTSGAMAATSASAEDLIAYQRAVDAAAARVAAATQAVAQAEIVSPIAGTIAAVNLAVGDDVAGGSATATIVVVGAGGYEVATTVSVADLPDLAVGQAATIRPDGTDETVTGEVVAIGVAGTSGGSTTTYPVTMGVIGGGEGLGNGATASVAIVTDAATQALAVPTSAVTVDGDRHTVTVVDGGSTEEVEVEVGAIGRTWTEISSGVEAGDEVVLAVLDEPLPSAATAEAEADADAGFGGPGGAGGATGGPPAGFTPPAGMGAPPGN